jgi:hypothetical protein
VSDTAWGAVTILVVDNVQVEKHVVDEQEKDSPFQEGEVKALDAFDDERLLVREVSCAEEITCRNKKQRHMELVEKVTEESGTVGMTNHHQYNGHRLTYRYRSISFCHNGDKDSASREKYKKETNLIFDMAKTLLFFDGS